MSSQHSSSNSLLPNLLPDVLDNSMDFGGISLIHVGLDSRSANQNHQGVSLEKLPSVDTTHKINQGIPAGKVWHDFQDLFLNQFTNASSPSLVRPTNSRENRRDPNTDPLTGNSAVNHDAAQAFKDNRGESQHQSTTNPSDFQVPSSSSASSHDNGLHLGQLKGKNGENPKSKADDPLTSVPDLATPVKTGYGDGLKGEYFDNLDLTNSVLVRDDATVDFKWGVGSPDPSIAPNTFSARWTGFVQPLFSEQYTFSTRSDDGIRLWVNDQLLVDHWRNGNAREQQGTITLEAGKFYDIKVEYYEKGGQAFSQLLWSSESQVKEIIPQSQLYTDLNDPLIGVIDTGFAANNPDFNYNRITLGQDRVANDNNPLLTAGEGNEHAAIPNSKSSKIYKTKDVKINMN